MLVNEANDKEIDVKNLITELDFREHVKIYSNDSELIKVLGSVFHNNKSRSMWLLLSSSNKEYYLKEMAVLIEKDENPRLPNYEYHIGVMVKAGIVLVRVKLHNKHRTKFYRAAPLVMLTAPHLYEKANKSKALKTTFHKVFKFAKFACIGIAGITTWFISTFHFASLDEWKSGEQPIDIIEISPLVISLIIIIVGLVTERVYSITKKKG